MRTVDHVVPLSRGGADGPSNWVLSCLQCNQRKGDMTASEFRAGRYEVLTTPKRMKAGDM